uniref:Uncharacterized protein n=1 Tax=Thermodesulfobacterium geofontis TaxID=1295609 RepID=A0A7V5XFV1_9BACT
MLKKLALALGCLGFLVATTPVFGMCIGDMCGVEDPKVIDVGYDLNIDVDVCVDAGNLLLDFWSAKAVIYQSGKHNEAKIKQTNTSQVAGIIQEGSWNEAKITQTASGDYALILQTPGSYGNDASIMQSLLSATAIIVQTGMWNDATITQR